MIEYYKNNNIFFTIITLLLCITDNNNTHLLLFVLNLCFNDDLLLDHIQHNLNILVQKH